MDDSFTPLLVYLYGRRLFKILTLNKNRQEKLSSALIAGGTPLYGGTRGHRNATLFARGAYKGAKPLTHRATDGGGKTVVVVDRRNKTY